MHFSVPTPVGPQTLCDVKGWRVIGIESKEVSNLSLSQVQDEMRSVGRPITMHFSAMPSVYDVEELKEQIRMRILGLGWSDLHTPWSKGGEAYGAPHIMLWMHIAITSGTLLDGWLL